MIIAFFILRQIGKTGTSTKNYFPAFLSIPLDRIIVDAPSIPHFKDLDMTNLQYEIRICKKSHNEVRITLSTW